MLNGHDFREGEENKKCKELLINKNKILIKRKI